MKRNMKKRALAFLLSAVMFLGLVPDIAYVKSDANEIPKEKVATPADASYEGGFYSIETKTKPESDVSGIVYKVYKDKELTQAADEFVLSFNGKSYCDKNGKVKVYESEKDMKQEETLYIKAGYLPYGTYFYKQEEKLYKSDEMAAVTGYLYDDEVKSFTVKKEHEKEESMLRVSVKLQKASEDRATAGDAKKPTEEPTDELTEEPVFSDTIKKLISFRAASGYTVSRLKWTSGAKDSYVNFSGANMGFGNTISSYMYGTNDTSIPTYSASFTSGSNSYNGSFRPAFCAWANRNSYESGNVAGTLSTSTDIRKILYYSPFYGSREAWDGFGGYNEREKYVIVHYVLSNNVSGAPTDAEIASNGGGVAAYKAWIATKPAPLTEDKLKNARFVSASGKSSETLEQALSKTTINSSLSKVYPGTNNITYKQVSDIFYFTSDAAADSITVTVPEGTVLYKWDKKISSADAAGYRTYSSGKSCTFNVGDYGVLVSSLTEAESINMSGTCKAAAFTAKKYAYTDRNDYQDFYAGYTTSHRASLTVKWQQIERASLKIYKIAENRTDSQEGAEFSIYKVSGNGKTDGSLIASCVISGDKTDNGYYKGKISLRGDAGKAGYQVNDDSTTAGAKLVIPENGFGWYRITETKAVENYDTVEDEWIYIYENEEEYHYKAMDSPSSGDGRFTLSKMGKNDAAVSQPGHSKYYNMAGIRYVIYEKAGDTYEKKGRQIVLSYDGRAYKNEDGTNVVFATSADKKAYIETEDHTVNTYWWTVTIPDVTKEYKYYYREHETVYSGNGSAIWYPSCPYQAGTEVVAATGFKQDKAYHQFTLNSGNKFSDKRTGENSVTDDNTTASASLKKDISGLSDEAKKQAVKGLEFTLYKVQNKSVKADKGERIGTFVTDASGAGIPTEIFSTATDMGISKTKTEFTGLPMGYYLVVEDEASAAKNNLTAAEDQYFEFTTDGQSHTFSFTDYAKGAAVCLKKSSADTVLTDNKCCSLAGGIFRLYADEDCTREATVYEVNQEGIITGIKKDKDAAVFVTDENGDTTPIYVAPGKYWVKEIKAPKGYMLSEQNPVSAEVTVANTPDNPYLVEMKDEGVSDPVELQLVKTDAEGMPVTDDTHSLAGAVFKVSYYDDYYDSKESLKGIEPVRCWYYETKYDSETGTYKFDIRKPEYLASGYESSEFYYNKVNKIVLPLGTVTMEEIKAPEGFNQEGTMENVAGVVSDSFFIGQVRPSDGSRPVDENPTCARLFVAGQGDDAFENNQHDIPIRVFTSLQDSNILTATNEARRADFELSKVNYETGDAMADVYFEISCKETGESHVIKTDKDGKYSSAATDNDTNTNGYDAVFASGEYDSSKEKDESCGLWFFGSSDSSTWDDSAVNKEKGALRCGYTYVVSELISTGNDGFQLLESFEFVVNNEDDENVIKLGTISNVPDIRLTSLEYDANTQTHVSAASEKVSIKDKVSYSFVTERKTYTLKGIVVDSSGIPFKDADGKYVTSNKTFKAEKENGSVIVDFSFNGKDLSGKKFVVYEYLYEGEDTTPLLVKDGKIDTTGVMKNHTGEIIAHAELNDASQTGYIPEIITDAFAENGEQIIQASEHTKITDIVKYSCLCPGQTYRFDAYAVITESGEKVTGLSASKTFTAEKENGSVDVVFPEFDATGYKGLTITVCEKLYIVNGEKEYLAASHETVDDERQQIHFADGHTTAADGKTGGHTAFPGKETTIVDTVYYSGLIVGKKYTVTGTIMDQETEKPLLVNGKEITKTVTFTAPESSGSIDISFTFDSSALAGKSIVVFEECYYNEKEIFVHTDINDKDQTVNFPEIGTYLAEKGTGRKKIDAGKKVTLIDRVDYKNLTEGETFTVKGLLYDATAKKFLSGKGAEKEVTFTAGEASGSIDVEFEIKLGKKYEEHIIVCFEYIYFNDELVASHEDADDADQSVTVTTTTVVKTGDSFRLLPVFILMLSSIAGFVLLIRRKKRK